MGHARALLGLTTRRQQIEVANLVPEDCRCATPSPGAPAAFPGAAVHRPAAGRRSDTSAWSWNWRTTRRQVLFQHTSSAKGKMSYLQHLITRRNSDPHSTSQPPAARSLLRPVRLRSAVQCSAYFGPRRQKPSVKNPA